MPDDTERLVVALEARIRDFERNMQKGERTGTRTYNQLRAGSTRATRQMEADMVRSTNRINQALATTSTRIGSFGKAFAGGLVAGAAVGALEGIRQAAVESTKSVLELSDSAKRAGVSFKAFQGLKFVAEQNRIDVDSLTDGLKELSLRADEFIKTGAGSSAEAFQRLGYDAKTLAEKLKEPDQLFLEIIGKLQRLDKAAQIRIADEVFGGTGGEKFVQLISKGEKGLRDQIKAAEDLGIVMDDSMVAKAEEVNQKFNLIATTIGTTLKSAIVDALSAWFRFIDSWKEFKDQQGGTLERRQSDLGMKRLNLETERSQIKAGDGGWLYGNPDGPLAKGRIHEIELELAKIAAEERQIVEEINRRVKAMPEVQEPSTPLAPITASSGGKGATPYATARQFDGASETRDRDILQTFFKSANADVDPKMTAWCAAFVNAALATNGLPGTGSNASRSFLNYGEATSDPRQGDIVVLKRGNDPSQGHVGFFDGYDEKGNVRVFGGNQSDGVNTKSFSRDDVLGYRSIPGAERGSLTDTLSDELDRRLEGAETMKDRADAYDEVIAKAREFIAEQKLEGEAVNMTEQAAARLRYEQQLLNEAKQAGLDLSPTQIDNMKALAAEMANAEAATKSLAKSQEDLKARAEEFGAAAGSVAKGFVTDLINGSSAADALKNALGRVADMMLDSALNQIFGGGGVQGGGLFGSLFSSVFGGIGKNANGTDDWRGGPTWVGERGPEIVNLPKHAQVVPNHELGMPSATKTRSLGRVARGSRDVVRLDLQVDQAMIAGIAGDIADKKIVTASGTIVQVAVKSVDAKFGAMSANASRRGK